MVKLYKYIENPNIYAVYDKATNTLIISTHPKAVNGVIYIRF